MAGKARIRIIGTGGTIAGEGKSSASAAYEAGKLEIGGLINAIDGLRELAAIETETLFSKGSEDLGLSDWIVVARRINELGARADVDGIVVTHGTDTLEEAAFFLDLVLKVDKPVVLTAAMRAATALSADGPANLYQSVQACVAPALRGRNVLVVINGQILAGWQAVKTDSVAFESFQAYPGAPVGRIIGNRMQLYSHPLPSPLAGSLGHIVDQPAAALPAVGIAYVDGGCGAAPLAALRAQGCRGVVIAGFGAGTIPEPMARLAETMADEGTPVVVSSRVQNVSVLPDTMTVQGHSGVVASRILNPQKSAMLLRLCLASGIGIGEINKSFDLFAAQG
jgi:L-asparaginase